MNLPKPTDSELEILQVLWQKQPATVREINEELNRTKETGYTTTLKLMQIMLEKGLLLRDSTSKQHVYQAAISEEETKQILLNRFIATTFQGNAMSLVMQALGNHHASDKELAQLKELLDGIDMREKS